MPFSRTCDNKMSQLDQIKKCGTVIVADTGVIEDIKELHPAGMNMNMAVMHVSHGMCRYHYRCYYQSIIAAKGLFPIGERCVR